MQKRGSVTKTIQAADVQAQWSQILDQIVRRETRVVIEDGGKPLAVVISADDFEWLKHLEAKREEAFKALDATREAFKDVSAEEIEREVARAIAEVRAENRRREQATGTS